MKGKRIAVLVLSCCLAVGVLTGCSQEDEKNQEQPKGTGKYVEEDVALPLQPGEEPWVLLKRADGQLEIYTARENDEQGGRYLSADGKEWVEGDASWLAADPEDIVTDIVAGADGNDYAVMADQEMKTYLLKETEEGKSEKISLPVLDPKPSDEMEGMFVFGASLLVMENGNLVLFSGDEVKVCDPAGQKVLHTFHYEEAMFSDGCVWDIRGGKLVLPGKEGQEFTIWDVERETEEASASYGSDVRSGNVILTENDELYYVNKEGIHHMNPEGTLVETLVEGSTMTMGDPQAYIEGFVQGSQDDFYVLYQGDRAVLKHYYFDENASIGAEKELTIYSLTENDTVRQAISIFRQDHPEVAVSYKTGASDTATTKADQLRVLNTELLNQNGADVLMLDDLPVDSLMEKGVLKDISGIIDPMVQESMIQKNIAECYRKEDGKIYAMPVRYGIPLLYGKQEMTEAMESLEKLETWLNSHPEKLIAGQSYGELTRLFVKLYEEELFNEDGTLSQEALNRCLSCIKMIGERSDAEMENDYLEEFGAAGGVVTGSYTVGDPEEEFLGVAEIRGMFDTMIPLQEIRDKGYPLVYGADSFIPHGLAGINSAAKEPELAEEFLKVLFSEELQSYDLQDGLPVNTKAAEAFCQQGRDSLEEDSDTMGGATVTVVGVEDGEIDDSSNLSFNFSTPLKTELAQLFEKAAELKKPASADGVLQDMVMEEAKAYYEGSQELENTVQAIIQKVDTYRAE